MAFIVGTGQAMARAGSGPIDTQTTPVVSTGSVEMDLHTFPLPANSLVVTPRTVFWSGEGTIANNANSKVLKVYFGIAMITATLPTSVAADWTAWARISRTGTNAQRYVAVIEVVNQATNAVTKYVSQGTLTRTETAAITMKVTATAVATNDVIQNTSEVLFR